MQTNRKPIPRDDIRLIGLTAKINDANTKFFKFIVHEVELAENDAINNAKLAQLIKALDNFKIGVQEAYLEATPKQKTAIIQFVNDFHDAIIVLTKRNKINAVEGEKAFNKVCYSIRQCKSLSESVDPIVSPIAYALGGIAGALIGIPVGAVAGIGGMVYIMAQSSNNVELDKTSIKALGIVGAIGGSIYGSIQGACYISDLAHSKTHRYFKPKQTLNDVVPQAMQETQKLLTSSFFKREIQTVTKLPSELICIIESYRFHL